MFWVLPLRMIVSSVSRGRGNIALIIPLLTAFYRIGIQIGQSASVVCLLCFMGFGISLPIFRNYDMIPSILFAVVPIFIPVGRD